MEDNDLEALRLASTTVNILDIRYRLATPVERIELAESRDRAWTAYALARHRLLEAGIIVTDAELDAIAELSREVGRAADTMELAQGALKLATILGRIALA